ncbi:MAG: type II toxin-antitoxin system VapC family toxin [Verrucomicrobia bacterium]|nr:type II toxin-antitoxin system VapC family toxin [Verrucomicrobiota bacterium]
MIYLPDTNVFSRYLRNRREDAPLCERLELELTQCRLSAIVLMELEYGVAKSPAIPQLRTRVESLCGLFNVDAFDVRAAVEAGGIRAFLANLKPNAQPIGPYDVLLAGHARALGAIFITHNIREFSRVPGLQVEDWQTA